MTFCVIMQAKTESRDALCPLVWHVQSFVPGPRGAKKVWGCVRVRYVLIGGHFVSIARNAQGMRSDEQAVRSYFRLATSAHPT